MTPDFENVRNTIQLLREFSREYKGLLSNTLWNAANIIEMQAEILKGYEEDDLK